MYVFLSSDAYNQYKHDVLRCIAAPIGAHIQFRYAEKWIVPQLRQSLRSGGWRNESHDGIICFVNKEPLTGLLPLVAIRKVRLQHVSFHGSTVSLILCMGDFAHADTDAFTKELDSLSGGATPQKISSGEVGSYAFTISTCPGSITSGRTIACWETVISALAGLKAFQGECFWTLLKIAWRPKDLYETEHFAEWPKYLSSNTTAECLIYHFHPDSQPRPPAQNLTLTAGGPLKSIGPSTVSVDSRYDLKRFRIRTDGFLPRTEEGWLRIQSNDQWAIDIQLSIRTSLVVRIVLMLFIAVMLAIPVTLATWQQAALTTDSKEVVALVALASGLAVAWTWVFGIRRPI